MPSISKFLFETSFDGPVTAAPAKPVRRNFTAAELEAEKGKAFAAGHAAGVAEATTELASRNAAAAVFASPCFARASARSPATSRSTMPLGEMTMACRRASRCAGARSRWRPL